MVFVLELLNEFLGILRQLRLLLQVPIQDLCSIDQVLASDFLLDPLLLVGTRKKTQEPNSITYLFLDSGFKFIKLLLLVFGTFDFLKGNPSCIDYFAAQYGLFDFSHLGAEHLS